MSEVTAMNLSGTSEEMRGRIENVCRKVEELAEKVERLEDDPSGQELPAALQSKADQLADKITILEERAQHMDESTLGEAADYYIPKLETSANRIFEKIKRLEEGMHFDDPKPECSANRVPLHTDGFQKLEEPSPCKDDASNVTTPSGKQECEATATALQNKLDELAKHHMRGRDQLVAQAEKLEKRLEKVVESTKPSELHQKTQELFTRLAVVEKAHSSIEEKLAQAKDNADESTTRLMQPDQASELATELKECSVQLQQRIASLEAAAMKFPRGLDRDTPQGEATSQEQSTKITNLEEDAATIKVAREQVLKKLEEIHSQVADIPTVAREQVLKQLEDIHSQIEESASQKQVRIEKIAATSPTVAREPVPSETAGLMKTLRELQERFEQASAAKNELQGSVIQMQERLERLEAGFNAVPEGPTPFEASAKIKELEDSKSEMLSLLEERDSQIKDLRRQLDKQPVLEESPTPLEKANEELKQQASLSEKQIQEISRLQTLNQELQGALERANEAVKQQAAIGQKQSQEIAGLRSQLDQAHVELGDARQVAANVNEAHGDLVNSLQDQMASKELKCNEQALTIAALEERINDLHADKIRTSQALEDTYGKLETLKSTDVEVPRVGGLASMDTERMQRLENELADLAAKYSKDQQDWEREKIELEYVVSTSARQQEKKIEQIQIESSQAGYIPSGVANNASIVPKQLAGARRITGSGLQTAEPQAVSPLQLHKSVVQTAEPRAVSPLQPRKSVVQTAESQPLPIAPSYNVISDGPVLKNSSRVVTGVGITSYSARSGGVSQSASVTAPTKPLGVTQREPLSPLISGSITAPEPRQLQCVAGTLTVPNRSVSPQPRLRGIQHASPGALDSFGRSKDISVDRARAGGVLSAASTARSSGTPQRQLRVLQNGAYGTSELYGRSTDVRMGAAAATAGGSHTLRPSRAAIYRA